MAGGIALSAEALDHFRYADHYVTVPQRPAPAGIDPYDLLDWKDYDIKEVEIEN